MLNPLATEGFSKAAVYDEHRPSYPPASVKTLLENCRVNDLSNAIIVDLAAGTGKFTQCLINRDESYNIIAVEPHEEMRKVLQSKNFPSVEVKDGLSTSIPLPDGEADAVIAAQAFHWFANEESLREIHRVLQPHGCFGMAWNIEDYNAPRDRKAHTRYEQILQDFVWSIDDQQPRFRHMQWMEAFDGQTKSTPFTIGGADPLFALPLGRQDEEWVVWLEKDKLWDRLNTVSQVYMADADKKEAVYKEYSAAVDAPDVEKNAKGEVKCHGVTYVFWTSKVPA